MRCRMAAQLLPLVRGAGSGNGSVELSAGAFQIDVTPAADAHLPSDLRRWGGREGVMLNKGLLVFVFAALAARADLINDCPGSIQACGPGGLIYQDYGCNVSNSSVGVNALSTGMTAKYSSLEIVIHGIGSTPDEDSPGYFSSFSVDAVARFTDLRFESCAI